MDTQTYTLLSAKTASNKLHPELVCKLRFHEAVGDGIHAGNSLDGIKRALFYGKAEPDDHNIPLPIDPSCADLYHGVLGIASEAGELLSALDGFMADELPESFRSNMVEELGDLLWYIAMLSRWLNVPISDIMSRNISKLRTRYPQGFTEYAAVNRDLSSEQMSFDLDAPP
jgi:NTP pyrophosphatase (non-canonical NTP hydrolase)